MKLFSITTLLIFIAINSQAFTLTGKTYSGTTAAEADLPSGTCQIQLIPQSGESDTFVADVYFDGQMAYGFSVSQNAFAQLKNVQTDENAYLAGQLKRAGDLQLTLNIKDNNLVGFSYSGISPNADMTKYTKEGLQSIEKFKYGVVCNLK